ncbi:MAG TPA: protein-disulfide reductase DsbD domain-containing protein [Bryobacteraceae bacterium]|nr:protein-disulfide reductase DsbD domain-containing protein [Bryobacteraceae bacterium]
MKNRLTLVCAVSLLLPLYCSAQQNKLIVHPPDPITVKRGESVSQKLEVGVLPGFHVNSNKPKDEYLIPLKLTWTSGPLQSQEITYPKPEEITVGTQSVVVFTGTFPIETKFQTPANAPVGSSTMAGKLRYQACDNQMCFRPTTVEVHVPVSVQ